MPGLNGILVIGVPVYTVLLTTMAWRAISRVQFYKVQNREILQKRRKKKENNKKIVPCLRTVFFNLSGNFTGHLTCFLSPFTWYKVSSK